jgi:stage V sporulation protein D (sporulation-specific penicillin-binding protein)
MIALSERLGAERFYSYVEKFGYLEKTGIDLPSEASTIFHKLDGIGPAELATASFGQRFKVTIINQLTAISAVANGGKLVTPYVVDKVIDSDGNIISDRSGEVRRQAVSEETANTVSDILIEGVNGDRGAKNAGVSGYDVAAKTGTSQEFDILDENGNSYLRIGSTAAYSVDGEKGVAVIIVVDEPNSQVKYGSVVAAPYVSKLLEKILPYLEHEKNGEEINVTVDNYVGMNLNTATEQLKEKKIAFEIVGNGEVITSQTPFGGDVLTYPISKIILYTEGALCENVTVPTLVGMDLANAVRVAVNSGLNLKILGRSDSASGGSDRVSEQSLPPGKEVKRGSVISIRLINTDFED